MLRAEFVLGALAAATAKTVAISRYVPATPSELRAYVDELRRIRGSITSVRVSRFAPSADSSYEFTMWPRTLVTSASGCWIHHVKSEDPKMVSGLTDAILSSRMTPWRKRVANTLWGVQFYSNRGQELWSMYLHSSRFGLTPTPKSFWLNDARIYDFLEAHFGEATKNRCQH